MSSGVNDALRRAFFPTPEELKKQNGFLENRMQERREFLAGQGFSEEEQNLLQNLEVKETEQLRSFQSYESRYSLLRSGIITVDQIRRDLENYTGEGTV